MTEHNQQSALLGKIVAYTELLVNDPRSTIFVSLAETYRKVGLFEDARDIVSKGLELHPDFGPAYVVLARIECQLDHYDASCAGFERALELDPNSLAALVGYARVKLLLQRPDEARDLLLHARSLSPADPVINKMLLGLPGTPEIREEPQQLTAVDESAKNNLTSLASTTLADLYLVQGLTDKALALYRQLLSRNPDDLDLRRKIKEIEEREEQHSAPAEKASITPSEEAAEIEVETDEAEADEFSHQLSENDSGVDSESATERQTGSETVAESYYADAQTDHLVEEGEDQGVSEQEITAEDMPALMEAGPESDPVQEAEAEIDAAAVSECQPATEVESHDSVDSASAALEMLNQWLDNIRQRREHV